MRTAARNGGMLQLHCEEPGIIDPLVTAALAHGDVACRHHALTRPAHAEGAATRRAIEMARRADAPLYIVHLSCEEALEAVAEAKARGEPIHAETCPHYLTFTDELYADHDEAEVIKRVISPPLRTRADVDALWAGLRDGVLDIVASDHVPDRLDTEKRVPAPPFPQISNGAPGIETLLSVVYSEGVAKGRIGVERMVEVLVDDAVPPLRPAVEGRDRGWTRCRPRAPGSGDAPDDAPGRPASHERLHAVRGARGERRHPGGAGSGPAHRRAGRSLPRADATVTDELVVVPGTPDRLDDVVTILGGNPEACLCQYWRLSSGDFNRARGPRRVRLLRAQLGEEPPAGMIAYLGDEPVGWCGFGVRQRVERLVRSRTIPAIDDRPVWSIYCFTVRTGHRRKGIARALLAGLIEYARDAGARRSRRTRSRLRGFASTGPPRTWASPACSSTPASFESPRPARAATTCRARSCASSCRIPDTDATDAGRGTSGRHAAAPSPLPPRRRAHAHGVRFGGLAVVRPSEDPFDPQGSWELTIGERRRRRDPDRRRPSDHDDDRGRGDRRNRGLQQLRRAADGDGWPARDPRPGHDRHGLRGADDGRRGRVHGRAGRGRVDRWRRRRAGR